MKTILITNDDGFDSPALLALVDALSSLARVIVVAPSSQKSACGHSLTITQPLRFIKINEDFYKLHDGTPTDCVYLALRCLLKEKPDLVVSGINLGSNMGEDTTYSGTVAGAIEGSIAGIPSVAFSQVFKDKKCDSSFALAKKVAFEVVSRIFEKGYPLGDREVLNVNIPPCKIEDFKGYKVCELGYCLYGNDAHLYHDPHGGEYYWLGGHTLKWDDRKEEYTDFKAIVQGYASLTPIKINWTHYDAMQRMQEWI